MLLHQFKQAQQKDLLRSGISMAKLLKECRRPRPGPELDVGTASIHFKYSLICFVLTKMGSLF